MGNVYNVTDAFTTNEKFLVPSQSFPAGTNVVVVDEGGDSYKYDALSGVVDLSAYATTAALTAATKDLLAKTTAESTYAKKTDISDMLTKTEASETYETKANVTATLKSYATTASLANYVKTADIATETEVTAMLTEVFPEE